jgi:Flp pilus assembly CpaE family ATPase
VAFSQSDAVVLVAQLWLKSVTHATRQLAAWRDSGIDTSRVHVCINRSGAKFKEGVMPKDFERVCGQPVHSHFSNDIRTAAAAEQEGRTIMELKSTKLAEEIALLTDFLATLKPAAGKK